MAYKLSLRMTNDKEITAEFDDIETAEICFEVYAESGVFKRVSVLENGNIIREWKND